MCNLLGLQILICNLLGLGFPNLAIHNAKYCNKIAKIANVYFNKIAKIANKYCNKIEKIAIFAIPKIFVIFLINKKQNSMKVHQIIIHIM